MATPVWITGFENGLAAPTASGGGLFKTVNGNPVVDTTAKRSGEFGLHINQSATTDNVILDTTGGGTPPIIVGRFYFKFISAVPSSTTVFTRCYTNAAQNVIQFRYNTSTTAIEAQVNNGTAQVGPTIVADTWYWVDFRGDCTTTDGTLDWSVNGSAQTQATNTITASYFTSWVLGAGAAATMNLCFDDVILSVTSGDYPIQHDAVIGSRPDGDIAYNVSADEIEYEDGTDVGAGNEAYKHLDESPWVNNATTDLVRQITNNTAAYCEISFANAQNSTIHGVRAVLQYAANNASAVNAACYILYANDTLAATVWGNNTTGADYSETTPFYKSVIVPAPGGGWTSNEVDGLKCRFGHGSNASSWPRWLGIMLEVAGNGALGPGANAIRLRWRR